MKDIEKKISHFVENQFPEFYKEDGPQFIAFLKAYYEYLEQQGHPLYEARSLPQYKDIDTTLDDFIVYFKEKYLKNIQFDTATNKILLIKNALNLYRSKGTERAVDLFFKLIYGTNAEVSYPADNILRISDGIWEKPYYLEISYSKYNINYVGMQVIGNLSNATAFVERYIRRKTKRGYVNLLYVSGINGHFRNGEVLGVNINNTPTFNIERSARLIGSVNRVEIIDKGRGFNVGDLVTFESDYRGLGGISRVAEISNATGVIDFIFQDGGWGYTLDADAIISEKVINTTNINSSPESPRMFALFENLIEPLANIEFTSATGQISVGDVVTRWANGQAVTVGNVIDVLQSGNTGSITVSHTNGTLVNSATYYIGSNTQSFYANTVENRTILGKVMGIPSVYALTVNDADELNVGDEVVQSNQQGVFARATITDINGNEITVSNTQGVFKNSVDTENYFYQTGTGNITTYSTNNFVLGNGTTFSNNYINTILYNNSNTAIGKVAAVINATALTLTGLPSAIVTNGAHKYGLKFPLYVENNPTLSANITNITSSVGVYQINKQYGTLNYSSANNSNIVNTKYVYQYGANNKITAKGMVITGYYDTGSGNLTIIPLSGRFETGTVSPIYTEGNTSSASIHEYFVTTEGGDYIASPYAWMFTSSTNTKLIPNALSVGAGADFKVGTIGDTETIFIGTDLLSANNVNTINFGRRSLSITSNSGFELGQYVYQEVEKIAFNANTGVNKTTGFFTIPDADNHFVMGDIVRYCTASGNTPLHAVSNNEPLYVMSSNSTGLILSYVFDKETPLSSAAYSDFGDGAISETGHYLYKLAGGRVFEIGSGVIRVRDVFNRFGNTGGGANTTDYGNGNVIVYDNNSVNTSITAVSEFGYTVEANQQMFTVPIAAAAYGFPKNNQGNIKDTIYSCLAFNSFTVGSIGSLSGIDPGAGYNIDPYVLAYQPFISSFNRKDFVITIENPSGAFVVGEKVNQTLANLVYYDLQVDGDVYTNTYTQKVYSINTQYDVNNANDFIYIQNTVTAFNSNTAIDSDEDFINMPNHPYDDGDYVRYYTNSGNTAIAGLSNNAFYYVVESNINGIKLSSTHGGVPLGINASSTDESGHNIVNFRHELNDGDTVVYNVPSTNTAISGLSSNTKYYVHGSNSSGFQLATSAGGANVNITANSTGGELHTISSLAGYLLGEKVYQDVLKTFNANTAVDDGNDTITIASNPFTNGDHVIYYTNSGNTTIGGLANNSYYYVVESNSTVIKLSSTPGGAAIALTKGSTETGHNIVATANATVNFIYKIGANSFVRINNQVNSFGTGYPLLSYTNPFLGSNVTNISLVSTVSTAKGIVKEGSNSSVLLVKRLTFENTFQTGQSIMGDTSGTTATITGVAEDERLIYPIGLNANIEANVVTANGQITSLQIIDSGFGFTNAEIVQYTSADGLRSGSIKLIVDGHGIGKGYYRSSKGFLSDNMYIHDGNYYQEYSYEVLSKMSIDKYASMFKQVMHVAGTKFFGSVRIVEEASVKSGYSDSSITQD